MLQQLRTQGWCILPRSPPKDDARKNIRRKLPGAKWNRGNGKPTRQFQPDGMRDPTLQLRAFIDIKMYDARLFLGLSEDPTPHEPRIVRFFQSEPAFKRPCPRDYLGNEAIALLAPFEYPLPEGTFTLQVPDGRIDPVPQLQPGHILVLRPDTKISFTVTSTMELAAVWQVYSIRKRSGGDVAPKEELALFARPESSEDVEYIK